MGPEFTSDIAGDGPRKRVLDEEEFDPELERSKKRKIWNSRRSRSKLSRQIDNANQHLKRSTDDRRKDNAKQHPKRSTDDRRKDNAKQNPKRSTDDRRKDNAKQNPKRKLKSDISGMEYDTSSPFPPTVEQLTYTGKILENSIAALFAQQSPSAEISYAVVVAEQLKSYTRPIIDFTMHQFEYECCHRLFGDLNVVKAAANKALHNLDKVLLINDHYQLMRDLSVWDVCNPPSLTELKLLSTRHPYQPISELLRKEIDSFKKRINAQNESIINSRKKNSEGEEDSQDQGFRLNVVGGGRYESSVAKDYEISSNEFIAFQANSNAKFKKVYREGITKCFLMPAEFKDDEMRNFYRVKFEQFLDNSGNLTIMKDGDHSGSFWSGRNCGSLENADFAEVHLERRKAELEYSRGRHTNTDDLEETDVSTEPSRENHGQLIDDNLPAVTNYSSTLKEDGIRLNHLFNCEVKRAQNNVSDARKVCLTEWEIRDKAQGLLEKICFLLKEIIRGKHVECDCKKTEVYNCKTLIERVDLYFDLLRKINQKSEGTRRISQILDNTLVSLEDVLGRSREISCLSNCTEVDKQLLHDRIDALQQFYITLGIHSTSLFYEKNEIYENLKTRPYKICCVCGTKNSVVDESTELKDAVAFKEVLVVEEEELTEWMALKNDDEDERGKLAQQCFHIASVEVEKKFYHILHVDDPDPDNSMEKSCCIINDGTLLRLPACDECFDRLKKANKFLKEMAEATNLPASDGGPSARERAIGMLKDLCFKRCDLGRIPKSLPKLSHCGRTAIAPFVAYTIIRQLRCSKYLPGSAQHSSKGSTFSIPTDSVAGKEFVIPLLHDEFVNSFQKELPRENVAERHRVLFLGSERDWNSMESTLNRQNLGQYFNALESYNLLKLLKRTGALSQEFTIKRKRSLGLLQRKVDQEMSKTSRTTDSSTGTVIEPSQRIHRMDSACSDDVAAARILTENNGMKTTAPGIASSLFWNKASHDGKLPLLKSMIGSFEESRLTQIRC